MSFLQSFNFSSFPSVFGGSGTSFSQQPSVSHFGVPNRFSTTPNLNNISPAHIQQNLHQYQNLQIPQSIQPQHQQRQQSSLDYYGNPVAQTQTHQQQQQPSQRSSLGLQHQVRSSPTANLNNNYDDDTIVDYYDPAPAPARAPAPASIQHQQQAPAPALTPASTRRRKSKKVSQRNILHYPHDLRVTPIQGPIYARDGLVPVVPLYAYSAVSNGTFYQIPILWTALSVALGLEVRGEILRGLPCIKRLNQLFCPAAGNTYPLESIERFIDQNKALIKRMYGEFAMLGAEEYGPVGGSVGNILRRSAREVYEDEVPDYIGKTEHAHGHAHAQAHGNHTRKARQTVNPRTGGPTEQPKSNRVDSCESKVEITTPYWAANSGGKVRAIVNTQHFEQAIHQEVCAKTSTARCTGDCGCEQKYKWHRLLAYDPDNDCKGIFMDWFLFPSCCVCRCNP